MRRFIHACIASEELPTNEQVDFFGVLNQVYQELCKKGLSAHIQIGELQEAVHKAQGYSSETFYRLLGSLPVSIGGKQILFSQASFHKLGGIIRNGKYYSFIAIYPNFWSSSEEAA